MHWKVKSRKQQLFESGVSAASAVYGTSGIYICPICTRPFRAEAIKSGELSLEHVPPRSLGGRAIILTCKKCNNQAGYSIDAQAANRARLRQFSQVFAEGDQDAGGPAILTMDGMKINVDVRRNGEAIAIKVLETNDPKVLQAHEEHVRLLCEGNRWDGEQFTITAAAVYNQRHARVSDLRAAFLLCTAAFGYSFAFAPCLKRVRAQILDPVKEILGRWWLRASDVEKKFIGIAEQDEVILVGDGSECVVLPYPPKGEKPFNSFFDVTERNQDFKMRITCFDWPTCFIATIDRNKQKKIVA